MKKKMFLVLLMAATVACASAQTKRVSILGDSYSTFIGVIPSNYATFYPNDRNDVTKVEQTWWSLYIKPKGMRWRRTTRGAERLSVAPVMVG